MKQNSLCVWFPEEFFPILFLFQQLSKHLEGRCEKKAREYCLDLEIHSHMLVLRKFHWKLRQRYHKAVIEEEIPTILKKSMAEQFDVMSGKIKLALSNWRIVVMRIYEDVVPAFEESVEIALKYCQDMS
jgi:hypothetical protein